MLQSSPALLYTQPGCVLLSSTTSAYILHILCVQNTCNCKIHGGEKTLLLINSNSPASLDFFFFFFLSNVGSEGKASQTSQYLHGVLSEKCYLPTGAELIAKEHCQIVLGVKQGTQRPAPRRFHLNCNPAVFLLYSCCLYPAKVCKLVDGQAHYFWATPSLNTTTVAE